MSDHIVERILEETERKYRINIIYAQLGGSHLHGFSDKKSDWDVFFVYVGKFTDQTGENSINIKQNYNNYAVNVIGIHINDVDLTDHHQLEGIRNVTRIYRNKLEFKQNIVDNVDTVVDEGDIKTSLRKEVRRFYKRIKGSKKGRLDKKNYIRGLIAYMRLVWIRQNSSVVYPIDVRELLEYYSDKAWYDDVKTILRNRRRRLLTINTKLFNILKNEIET